MKLRQRYYVEFWRCRDLEAVLVVVFEELERDLRALLPDIAAFAGVAASADALDRVAALSGRDSMARASAKFDESWAHARLVALGRMGDPSSYAPAPRVRARDDVDDALAPDALAFLDAEWRRVVAPATGHATYAAFAASLGRLPPPSGPSGLDA